MSLGENDVLSPLTLVRTADFGVSSGVESFQVVDAISNC